MKCASLPRQRGAVLIVGLVMLLILTILGLAGSRNTTLEERMSGNYRDRNLAFQAAEAALRAGEALLADDTTFYALTWSGSGYVEGDGTIDPFDDTLYALSVTDSTLTGDLHSDPEYFIERLPEFSAPKSSLVVGTGGPPTPKIRFYRISGKGSGMTPNSEVILQSSFYRQ